jgi:hypothetical protein
LGNGSKPPAFESYVLLPAFLYCDKNSSPDKDCNPNPVNTSCHACGNTVMALAVTGLLEIVNGDVPVTAFVLENELAFEALRMLRGLKGLNIIG